MSFETSPLACAPGRPFLIDVSRLIWRFWTRRLPTGIDRVCLAYLDHYGGRSRAVVQRRGQVAILSAKHSQRLFHLLRAGRAASRSRMFRLLAAALPALLFAKVRPGTIYFNVGHTGLNEPALPRWIAAHQVRAIYMVHDLIPLTHPQFCRAGEADRHDKRMANMVASASGVIGNSQATLDELANYAASRSWPMPPSLAAWISGPPAKTTPTEKMLDSPYFVTLGTIEGRKNHLVLLDVWRTLIREMGRKAPTLVLIGQRGWESERVQALLDQPGLFSGKVIELNECSDDDLANWIGGARALLMPSFAEGFGLPIVEALGLGCPVIASDLPVFREIGRSIPTFIHPTDQAGWSSQIRDFSGPDPERDRQIEEMKAFRAPGWAEHFARVDRWLGTL